MIHITFSELMGFNMIVIWLSGVNFSYFNVFLNIFRKEISYPVNESQFI